MSNSKLSQAEHQLMDSAAQSLDHAIESTRRVAGDWAQQGVAGVREATHDLQDKARQASASTVHYIQHDPLKAMLMAAATGAVLMALVGLMSRSSHPRA